MSSAPALTPALKGSSFTLSVLHLTNNHVEQAITLLQQKIAQAPNFFARAPLVLNIEDVADPVDFEALNAGIIELGMRPVGVVGCATDVSRQAAFAAGLATLNAPAHSAPQKRLAEKALGSAEIIRTPVRSGQQIYAQGTDLVVLGSVSNGAELIADGSIHVHGVLRGRAIAGAAGRKEASISCRDLQAELISVAGNYWLSDNIPPEHWQRTAVITRSQSGLVIESVGC